MTAKGTLGRREKKREDSKKDRSFSNLAKEDVVFRIKYALQVSIVCRLLYTALINNEGHEFPLFFTDKPESFLNLRVFILDFPPEI